MSAAQTITFHYETNGGKIVAAELDPVIDIRDFEGTAGYSLLVVAASVKTGLPISALWEYLLQRSSEPGLKFIRRPSTWLQKRRWLFLPARASNRANRDGRDNQALTIMSAEPEASIRDLARTLRANGIKRSREWIRKARCLTNIHHN